MGSGSGIWPYNVIANSCKLNKYLKKMKKSFVGFLICLMGCLAFPTGCSTDLFDYEEMNDRIDDFEQRLSALENWCNETNVNINSLKALVESLVIHDVITGVNPLMKDGKQIQIMFFIMVLYMIG